MHHSKIKALKRRGLQIKNQHRVITITEPCVFEGEQFCTDELCPYSTYEVVMKHERYGDSYAVLNRTYERMETNEELASRLIREYDKNAGSQSNK